MGRRARGIASRAVAAASIAAWAGPALAAEAFTAETAAFALPGLAAAAAALAVLLHRAVRTIHGLRADLAARERDAASRAALLDAAPVGCLAWSGESEITARSLGALFGIAGSPAFADLLARLAPDDASALNAAVQGLRRRGEGFDLNVMTLDGARPLRAVGRRVARPVVMDSLWIEDRSAAAGVEAELTAARSRLRRALDSLPVPIWFRGPDLAIRDANAAFARALDLATPEEAVRSGSELLSGGNRRALATRAHAAGAAVTAKAHGVVAGSRRWLEVTERPLDGAEEFVGFALDHTDVEQAEAERERHIAAHRGVLERLSTPIIVFGADTRVKFWNRAYAGALGVDESWLASEPTFVEVLEALRQRRLISEEADFPAFKRERLKLFTSLLDATEEFQYLPDGRTLRVTIVPHPMGGLMFTHEDLTDRLALERSYNTLIDVQRETLDNLYEAVAVFGGDGRLKLFNPAFARMWGMQAAALAAQPHISDVLARTEHFFRRKDGQAPERELFMVQALDRTPVSGRLERSDGSVLDFAKVPLPDGETLMSFVDVTDRTRVELALRERTEALEAADRLKSEFIANVSYELRTPLNAIVGFAEILNNQYFGTLNTRQGEYVQGVIQASNRLLALINDILDLAMIEAGRMTLDVDRVDVHGMMVSVFTLARDWARKQALRFEFDCPGDIGSVVADERRLKQALFNLISNAVKFTPAGGSITVSARRQGGGVCFVVTDTGIGIPSEKHGHVFEKFARGKDGSGRYAGVGLGLALVRHIVELHNGTVSIRSVPNEGTEVTCVIPVAMEVPIALAQPQGTPASAA